MNESNTNFLFDTYPILYRDRNLPDTQSLVCFGFPGDGWFKLIKELSEEFELLNNTPDCPYYVTAAQMKEKFGTLRFYINLIEKEDSRYRQESDKIWRDIIYSIESSAELKSSFTCEICGEYGELRKGGWLRTLCNKCENKRNEPLEQ
jgi:hypothetical protein